MSQSTRTAVSASILHLSDLHFGKNSRFSGREPRDLGKICAESIAAEMRACYFGEKPDLVVVTGDITQTAQEKEYGDAKEFFIALQENFGIDRSRFVFVPGNHDVDWDACRSHTPSGVADYDADLSKKKFQCFEDFKNSFYTDHTPPVTGIGREGFVADFVDLKVSIAGLNSCEKETDTRHCGFVSEKQIQALMDKWKNGYDGCMKIIAIHHPVNAIPEKALAWKNFLEAQCRCGKLDEQELQRFFSDAVSVENNSYINAVIEDRNVHILLHGHQHSYDEPQPHRWKSGEAYCHICPAGSFGLIPEKLPREQPNCLRLLHFEPERAGLKFQTVSLQYDPLDRQPGFVVLGCFRNKRSQPPEVKFPPLTNEQGDGKRDDEELKRCILEPIETILENNKGLASILSNMFADKKDPLPKLLVDTGIEEIWYKVQSAIVTLSRHIGDVKKILFWLAANEAKPEVMRTVRDRIHADPTHAHLNIEARYPVIAEIILSAALKREIRVEMVPLKDGRVYLRGKEMVVPSEEGGILHAAKKNDVYSLVTGKLSSAGQINIKDPGFEQRIQDRLKTFFKSNQPFYVVHDDAGQSIGIPYLIEFVLPAQCKPMQANSITATSEDSLLALIEIIITKFNELQPRGN